MSSFGSTLSTVWATAWPIILAILLFELIIIVHEFGHYITAKWNGIRVNEFAIGMGPKLFSFTRGETQYSLRLLPIGGYCAMEGEDEDSDDEKSFSNKAVWRRIIVVCAGAVCNLILGFLFVVLMISQQNLVGTTQVAKFDDDAVSPMYGLQVGDEIKSINGMRVFTSTDISTGLSRDDDGVVDLVVKRDGELVELNGVVFETEEYESGNTTRNLIKMDFYILGKEKTITNVLSSAVQESVALGRTVFLSLYDLVSGRYGLSELSGPVGTVSYVAQSVSVSYTTMFRIMGLISINIGIFNLFPIPALDGWRLFVLIGEGITRKKMNKNLEYAINAVGLILLLGLMVVVTFSDISRLL
ncbi:MAG: site-2 protease family protein [Clostridiales bacterium]|nr:site-2 protease family protein [Clostridiales bacterium]